MFVVNNSVDRSNVCAVISLDETSVLHVMGEYVERTTYYETCEISGSHGVGYVVDSFMGYSAV
jgi:hypothetical protein